MSKPSPILSVIIICYNHSQYIRTAVQSALDQDTDFDYEVIVVDDASTDDTQNILHEFEDNLRVKVIANPENKGPNFCFLRGIEMSKGKYFANLEGDDYWIDPLKLQKQINYLEAFPNVSCVGTEAYARYDLLKGLYETYLSRGLTEFTSSTFIQHPMAHSCTMVYRREHAAMLPDVGLQPYDMLMHILYAQKGKAVKLSDYTSVYRIHPNGLWTSIPRAEKHKNGLKIRRYLNANSHFQDAEELKAYEYCELKIEVDALVEAGRLGKAIYLLERFDGNKDIYLAQFQLGQLYIRAQRWPQFIASLNWLKRQRTDDPGLAELECRFYHTVSKIHELSQFSRRKSDQYPDNMILHNFYLRSLIKTGTTKELQVRLNYLTERFSSAPPLMAQIMRAFNDAKAHLETAEA